MTCPVLCNTTEKCGRKVSTCFITCAREEYDGKTGYRGLQKSSWSLRAWLVMVTADAAFDTVQIMLEQPDTHRRISEYSPSGKVPALLSDNVVINDSLAISEYIAEAYPDANLWPRDTRLRALARSAAAEMHSGFTHLRTQMAFGLGAGDDAGALTEETKEEIARIFPSGKGCWQRANPAHSCAARSASWTRCSRPWCSASAVMASACRQHCKSMWIWWWLTGRFNSG